MEDFMRMGVTAVAERARAVVGDGPIYISVDVNG
jgi:agmatinase